jgi:hypothetical protein
MYKKKHFKMKLGNKEQWKKKNTPIFINSHSFVQPPQLFFDEA